MADETLLDKDELNIPSNLDNLKLYGVNSEQNTDGRVNASLLAQALGRQTGNIPIANRGDLTNVAFTETDDPEPLIEALNALPLQRVPHGWIAMFSTVRITATSSTSFIADKRFYVFASPLPGNSDANFTYYGQGSGTPLTTLNTSFKRFEQLIITAENGVLTNTGAFNLGNIGTSSVADVVNNSGETYTESNGVIIVSTTDDNGEPDQFYIYNGSEKVIGNGGAAVTDDDFTVVDPANSVPAASDVYIMGGQLQNLVIEGVQNEVTSVELLATVFRTEEGGVIEGDNIPKYLANFEVTSTGIRATLLRRVKLDSAFRVDRFCENATKLDDVQGLITSIASQGFLNNTNIQEIVLPSVTGSTQNIIVNCNSLTKLVVPKVDTIDTKGCTSLTYLDARGAATLGSLEGCPLTDYLNIDRAEDLVFNNNFRDCQKTEINLNTLIRINSQNITQNSLIEVFRTPLLESMSGGTFRYDTKIKELRLPNLLEVNPEGVTAHTFQMSAIELIEAPKCKVFGSNTVVNGMFLDTDLSNCKIVVNEHLKTSNNGGINANIQDAIDKGATVVFAKDYAEEVEGGLTQANLLQSLTSSSTTDGVAANKITELADQVVILQQILFSDDATLDELQEVVDFIKQNKTELETLGISNIAGLVDALDGKATISQGVKADNSLQKTGQSSQDVSGVVNHVETSAGNIVYPIVAVNSSVDINTEAGVKLSPSNSPTVRYAAITGVQEGSNQIGVAIYTGVGAGISKKVYVTSLGKVGIGNTNPAEKLDVTGTIKGNKIMSDSFETQGQTGVSGSFTSNDGKTITVTNGLITNIV